MTKHPRARRMIEIVKAAHPSDLEAIAELARDIWVTHYVPIIGRAQVDYMLDRFQSVPAISAQLREGAQYYLLKEKADCLGYFGVVPNSAAGEIQLSKIYVHDEQRGRGLGRKIMAFLEGYCADGGFREMWLTVNRHNTGSVGFYERMGFQKTGTLVIDIGGGYVMDDYKMSKRLPGS